MSGSRTGTTKAEVVLLATHKQLAPHEIAVHQALARKIAVLLGAAFDGFHDSTRHKGHGLYFIPSDTLIGADMGDALNIRSMDDLFGGLANEPFMATKAISHPLPESSSARPSGWSDEFHRQAGAAVLTGFTAFDLNDALKAGTQLLANGPVRIKPVLATAGRGQIVALSEEELTKAIAGQDADEVRHWGLVVEENLQDVVTYSVGQVQVAGITASYHGTQSLTTDNLGETVYGGSRLWIVRGDYDVLLSQDMDTSVRQAIEHAIVYDKAACDCFPGLVASRRNYDIAKGTNARGQVCFGVLEQSWRIGGASPAEIEALMAFAADPALQRIQVSTHEIYGQTRLPANAHLLYEGEDPQVGVITKFIQVEPYECAQ
ncbi:DUF3182 family protein [Pseudomonas cichorii]|uniref:DUF3182 family protein n=1 Tax=Pseudomonas cichorii TaxID=36746 RepID=UPI0019107B46|nr:DUF3182 family protein [Pseudomonas cichorii]MBX8537605.1 DUF3182 family protein [Pseudomonas cichorii]MBX8566194.1 DUF3182 family protein [Pseudomonas cichorii]GFM67867.1 hypothetical protein PSCICJ_39850 [Pseudomonas cichorii]